MSERLSASDMSSLLAERGPIHVHVGATIVAQGKPPAFGELVEHVDSRLGLIPRFRQRITSPGPMALSNPVWADDPRFDVERHVRRVALPAPGGMAELRELVGRVMSEPLDLTRPLWQLYLVEGLERKRHAYINKTHHALVDGVAAVDVGTIILDATPEGTQVEVSEERWEPDEPSPELLFVRDASDRIRSPLRAARKAALGALTMPRSTAGPGDEDGRGVREAGRQRPDGGAHLPEPGDRPRPPGRLRRDRPGAAEVDPGPGGATVNDVILSVATGGLRRLFERRGERPPENLVGLVPMSIRRPGEDLELGNRIATLLVRLPIAETEPATRLELINQETTRVKASEQATAASLIIEATGWTPPTVNRVLADAMSRPLAFNLVVSNVPGPQAPFYLLGRKLEAIYPFVPLSPQNHALSIGVLSYDGSVFFGLAGDRDLLADLDRFAADIEAALAEQAAGGG